jgi:hypothetical protein
MNRFKLIFMNLNRKFLQEKVSLRPMESFFGIRRAENIIYREYRKDLNARLAKEYLRKRDILLNLYLTKIYRGYTETQSEKFTKLVNDIASPSGLSKFSFYVKSKANTLQNEKLGPAQTQNTDPSSDDPQADPVDPPNTLMSTISEQFRKIIGKVPLTKKI